MRAQVVVPRLLASRPAMAAGALLACGTDVTTVTPCGKHQPSEHRPSVAPPPTRARLVAPACALLQRAYSTASLSPLLLIWRRLAGGLGCASLLRGPGEAVEASSMASVPFALDTSAMTSCDMRLDGKSGLLVPRHTVAPWVARTTRKLRMPFGQHLLAVTLIAILARVTFRSPHVPLPPSRALPPHSSASAQVPTP